MPENNINSVYSSPVENRGCCGGNSGFGCDSEILFFIIIFLLLFTNCGCCGRG